jgi:putative glycosyltransferase (TIGR04372 family)
MLEDGQAIDEIVRRFEKVGGGRSLLTIDDEFRKRGIGALRQLGIPDGSWWVALHVREASYHGVSGSPRNADPLSYRLAVRAIIERGGYVIRIGDTGTTPFHLPLMDGLVDFAHSSNRSDWLDMFIVGNARFLLGNISGPNEVAHLFGVPVAAANAVPMSQGLLGRQDIRIPKLLMMGTPPNALSFDHVLGSKLLRDLHTKDGLLGAGVTLKDNTAEEIRELAVEMMHRLDGVADNEPIDDQMQSQFQDLVAAHKTPQTFGTMSRIGRHFLRSHSSLFEPESVSTQNPSRTTNAGGSIRRNLGAC